MILTARERTFRTLVTALEGINVPAGYNTTVRHVRRSNIIVWEADDPPEIHLLIGTAKHDQKSPEEIWDSVPLTLRFFAASTEDAGLAYNLFLGDIQRALFSADGSWWDESGCPYGGPRVLFHVSAQGEDRPQYWEPAQGSQTVGEVDYEVTFSRLLRDPRLSTADDVLVEG